MSDQHSLPYLREYLKKVIKKRFDENDGGGPSTSGESSRSTDAGPSGSRFFSRKREESPKPVQIPKPPKLTASNVFKDFDTKNFDESSLEELHFRIRNQKKYISIMELFEQSSFHLRLTG